jgi:branched-subunit amino acid aminotransferase/4-amino-4-deoxychorismate lyase
VWWQDEVLCAPDQTTDWLPSITRELVFEIAGQAGYETKETSAAPEELAGCEVWSLSALQGIRGVTSWGEIVLGQLRMQRPFGKRLALLNQKLPSSDEVFEAFGAS